MSPQILIFVGVAVTLVGLMVTSFASHLHAFQSDSDSPEEAKASQKRREYYWVLAFFLTLVGGMTTTASYLALRKVVALNERTYTVSYAYGHVNSAGADGFGYGSATFTLCGRKLLQSDLDAVRESTTEELTKKLSAGSTLQGVIPLSTIESDEKLVDSCPTNPVPPNHQGVNP